MINYTDNYYSQCRSENLTNSDWPVNREAPRTDHVALDYFRGCHRVPKSYWSDEEIERCDKLEADKKAVELAEDDRIQTMIADFEARQQMRAGQ